MRKFNILLLFICLQIKLFGQWHEIETNIDCNLNAMAVNDSLGVISSDGGVYYSNNIKNEKPTWLRFSISDNINFDTVYNNTEFSLVERFRSNSYYSSYNTFLFIGENRKNSNSVVLKIEFPSLNYELIELDYEDVFIGLTYTGSNAIDNREGYIAVGKDGTIYFFPSENIGDHKILHKTEQYANYISIERGDGFSPLLDYFIIGAKDKYAIFHFDENEPETVETEGVCHNSFIVNDLEEHEFYSFANTYNTYDSGFGKENSFSTNFDFGPLNAICSISNNDIHYVGTDHGIFISNKSTNTLEWQPSSLKYKINDLWKVANEEIIFACSDNGVLLKSESTLESKPYNNIKFQGTCSPTFECVISTEQINKDHKCQWFIDGKLVNEECSSFTYEFDDYGKYELKLIIKNDYHTTEYIKPVYVEEPPQTDKIISIENSTICVNDSLTIDIQNSQIDVQYLLRKNTDSNIYGISEGGNGGVLTFLSDPIVESGTYYLQAENINSGCKMNFSKKFNIEIKNPKSEIHPQLINILSNEEVTFYNYSINTTKTEWSFNKANNVISSSQDSISLSFSEFGQINANLKSYNDNDCYSEVDMDGPYVYENENYKNSSWSLTNRGKDYSWRGFYTDDLSKISKTKDGYLICGSYNKTILNSNSGRSYDLGDFSGGYLAKYNFDGVLKWVVRSKTKPDAYLRDQFYDSVEDNQGNIYVCGSGFLVYDSSNTLINSTKRNFILKLNYKGELIWKLEGSNLKFDRLFIDHDNNLIATAINSNSSPNQLYLNDEESDVLIKRGYDSTDTNKSIVKFSENGKLKWNVDMSMSDTNGSELTSLGFDKLNNIFFSGYYEYDVKFYPINNGSFELKNTGVDRYGGKTFLGKISNNGELIWLNRGYSKKEDFLGNSYPNAMIVNDDGNLYITGFSHSNPIIENSNGTITENNIKGMFVAKVDTNGNCQWIHGINDTSEISGSGSKILLHDEEIFILGSTSGIGICSLEGTNNFLDFNVDGASLFLAVYDTNGNLKRLVKSKPENDTYVNSIHSNYGKSKGFFMGSNEDFYFGQNIGFKNNQDNYSLFNHVLRRTYGTDGVVTHFKEEHGTTFYPLLKDNLSNTSVNKINITLLYTNIGEFKIVNLNSTHTYKICIYSINGQMIFQNDLKKMNEFSHKIKNANGIYLIKLIDTNGFEKEFKILIH